jgi:hypothetical protein
MKSSFSSSELRSAAGQATSLAALSLWSHQVRQSLIDATERLMVEADALDISKLAKATERTRRAKRGFLPRKEPSRRKG